MEKKKIHYARLNYNNYLENDLPNVDAVRVEEQFHSIFNPMFDKMKDTFFDLLPELERQFKQSNYIAPLMKLDSYGLPVYDFMEDWTILDNYFPAYRDKIIEEIENEDYDLLTPKGSPTIDDVAHALHIKTLHEKEYKMYKDFDSEHQTSTNINPKKKEYVTNLRKLKSSYEEKKLIDNEINSLRSKVDTLKQEDVSKGAASEEEGDKKVTTVDTLALLYEYAHSLGWSRDMINPNYTTGKSKEELAEITDRVRKEYYAKKGIPEPAREQIFYF